MDRYSEAEKAFDKAIELEKQDFSTFLSFNHKMDFLERNNKFTEAINELNKNLIENPYNKNLYFKRGEIHLSDGNNVLAKKDFEIALQYGLIEAKSKLKNIA